MKINLDKKEIVLGKLNETHSSIIGFLKEAEGDLQNRTSYSSQAVYKRLKIIYDKFMVDVEKLSNSLEL